MWQLGKGGNNHCILTALEARTHYLLQKICSLPKKTSTKCIYFMKMQPEYSVTNKIKQYQIGLKGSASVSVSVSVSVRSQSV